MLRIGLYARISTNDGRQDAENQLRELRRWAKRLGGKVIAEYVDKISGSKSNRIQLNRLLKDAHHRKIDTVLVWSLDRLSREGIGRMAHYIEQFKSCGVELRSLQEPWVSASGPVSELLVAVFAWVGQFERQRIQQRILAGLKRARSNGKRLGRPEKRIDLHKARLLRAQGHSLRQIAHILSVPRSTLQRSLSQKPHANVA